MIPRPYMPRVLTAIFVGLAFACCAGAASAQTKTGTAIGQFLLIQPSARIAAMGNAGASIAADLQAAYYNPAVIGQLDHFEVSFSHAAWLAGISHDYVAVAIPLKRWGNLLTSVTSLNSGNIDVRTVAQPLGTGEQYSVNDVAIGVGYGFQVTDRVTVGGQISYVQETIWHSSAGTPTLGVGTLYEISDHGLRIGASLANVGTSARFDGRDLRILYDNDPSRFGDNGSLPGERFTSAYPVPMLFRVGLAMPVRLNPQTNLLFAADALQPSDNTQSVSLGGEIAWRDRFAFRAGYQNLMEQDSQVGLTLGAGAKGRLDTFGYRIDYAWASQGIFDGTHRFSLGATF
jgi:hypothetical protein